MIYLKYNRMKEVEMEAIYRLRTEELNEDFINTLKSVYYAKAIEIRVQEMEDETEYLLSSEENRKHLERSKAAIESREGLIEVSMESLESCV